MTIDKNTANVLLIEDEPLDARLVQLAVRNGSSPSVPKFIFHHHQTLDEAALAASEKEFDLVMLDLGLPGSSGLETLQLWLEMQPNLPVVVLTGLGDESVAAKAIKHGAQDYLVKNEWEGGVVRAMCYAIERSAARQQIREKEAQLLTARKAQQEAEVRAAMADELEAAKVAAESASQAKSEFMANISHELRTPLHAILGYSQLASKNLDPIDDGKMAKYWSRINQSGELLLSLVDDLLDLSKLEAGAGVLDRTSVDINDKLASVAAEFQVIVEQKFLDLELEFCADGDTVADGNKLKQVLRNLLSNAIKFSTPGSCVLATASRNGDRIQVCVADKGPGVPEEERLTIFDKFNQSSRIRTGAGGTGLGLAIARGIVRMHGGDIWVEDNPGGGSRFIFEIPANVPSAAPDNSLTEMRSDPQICT